MTLSPAQRATAPCRLQAPRLHEWLAAEPFTLALSSGFFGFFAHCGALAAVLGAGLRPARLSGSSAGALIAGLYAAGLEPDAIIGELSRLRRADFWDPFPGPGRLRGKLLRRQLERLLPVERFEQCRIPLCVSAYDILRLRTGVFDNGRLAPAIHASCCVPLLFHPVWLRGRPWLDGGIADRPGLAGVAGQARTLHHHLPSRRRRKASAHPPRRDELVSVTAANLPRLTPQTLEIGPKAFVHARDAMRRALDQPLTPLIRA